MGGFGVLMSINFDDYPPDLARLLRTAVNTIDALSNRMDSGDLSAAEWQERMTAVIRRAHEQAMLEGAGMDELTPEMEQVINRQVSVQTEFLGGFLDDIGIDGWVSAFAARARMYGTAATTAYWHGNIIAQVGKILPLPAYPGEGSQCLTNCKCEWRVDIVNEEANDYDAYWIVNSSETCQTCIERGQQWQPVQIRDGVLI